jgi:ubiquinone/menaquinone biosynthesis C-methylase UbiE
MTTDTRFWDNFAATYAAKPVKDLAAFERKRAVLREHLQPGANVFELGCGTGSLALEMARWARHITALDSSEQMIRIADKKRLEQGWGHVRLLQHLPR